MRFQPLEEADHTWSGAGLAAETDLIVGECEIFHQDRELRLRQYPRELGGSEPGRLLESAALECA